MKKVLVSLFLILCLVDTSFAADSWCFDWRVDEMTDNVSCLVFSKQKRSSSGYGNKSYISLSIQDSGTIGLHSKNSPFDPAKYSDIGIRVDKNKALFGVVKGYNSNMVQFNSLESLRLLNEMKGGKNLKVQVVFFPEGKRRKLEYGLLGDFAIAITSWQGCHHIKNSDGWVGVYLTQMGNVPEWVGWLEKNKIKDTLGLMVFTLDPKRAGGVSGLEQYDVIFSYDGTPATVDGLINYFKAMGSGDKVLLEIARNQKFKKITINKP